jgi:hypothetical protein
MVDSIAVGVAANVSLITECGPRPCDDAEVERCLAPTLGRGDIVTMDNLPTHKIAGVMEAIEAADGMAIYLPAYSPDLNPIEQGFSKLKALLRKAATGVGCKRSRPRGLGGTGARPGPAPSRASHPN